MVNDPKKQPADDLIDWAVEAVRRSPVPPGPSAETLADTIEAIGRETTIYSFTRERKRKMRPILKIAVAATLLAAVGFAFAWFVIGGASSAMAFSRVADALDGMRSATCDLTTETKGTEGRPPVTMTGKGFFLAPSRQRMEMSAGSVKNMSPMIMIFDGQAAKSVVLMPMAKVAMVVDSKKMREDMKKLPQGAPPELFEMVRQLVREGSSGTGEKVERLGEKEIDGREAVGFRIKINMCEMTLWADPKTALPVRIEMRGEMFGNVLAVMSNFRYNLELAPSLFSLEPPEGYSTQPVTMTMPVEEDLIRTLRTVAEHGKGVFPAKLGINEEVMAPLMAVVKPEMDKLEAKYGIKPKPGERPPAAMLAELMKTAMPLFQRELQGVMFYMQLKPANDPHYVGGGVKLNAPDRPILWYKPTDAEKYRVIYADLSVKEMDIDEVKKLPEMNTK